MVTRKVIEVLATKFVNPKLRQSIYTGLKAGSKEAQQKINSIFQNNLKNTNKAIVPTMIGIGLINDEAEARNNEPVLRAAKRGDLFKASVQDYFRTLGKSNEAGAKARQDAIIDIIGILVPTGKAASSTKAIANKGIKLFETQGVKAATDYIVAATTKLRNDLVKLSPKAKKQIDDGVMSVQEFLSKYGDDVVDEGDNLAKLVKENSAVLKDLAKELEIKSKAELPNLIKFTRQLGDVIKNSPSYIKSAAKGDKIALLSNVGLSMYDLYQAYKENNNSLLPENITSNVARIGAGLLPGNTLLKIMYGGLGYVAGDKLTQAGLRRLGVKRDVSKEEQKEIEQGLRHPGLSSELPEYIQGQSGKKYHVLNDKIYDFSTGRPVNIQTALQDASDYVNFQTQQANDQLALVNQQIADVEGAIQQGYQVPQENLNQLYVQKENLIADIRDLQSSNYNLQPDYDDTTDLVEQYRQREVEPVRMQQQAQQADRQQQVQQTYETVFNKIADDTFRDLDRFYTDEALAVDYFNHMGQYAMGNAPYMRPEDFRQYTKMKAMQQLAPQIQQNALNYMNNLAEQEQKRLDYEFNVRKQVEAERAARAGEMIKAYEAESGRMSSQAAAQNAITNRMELGPKQTQAEAAMINAKINQQYLPYKQAAAMGSAIESAAFGDLPLDQFLNSNQSIMSQVFPDTNQQQQGQQ